MRALPAPAALCAWLAAYGLAPDGAVDGVPSGEVAPAPLGWRVETDAGVRWIWDLGEAPLALVTQLLDAGIPCPRPLPTRDGALGLALEGATAALVAPLAGAPLDRPTVDAVAQLGEALGRLHGTNLAPARVRPHGGRWAKDSAAAVAPPPEPDDQALIERELFFQSLFRFHDLPRGLVLGGVPRARTLFDGGRLSALTAVELAGEEVLLYDVAAAALEWCWGEAGLDEARTRALLAAYRAARPTEPIERGAWPVLVRAAALEAWLEALLQGAGEADQARARLQTLIADEARVRRLWEVGGAG
ncbi:homoserine kinase [Ectothiorhodospiraceae bacterium 2226]|nr:homoserine kinase [Ectothiorhodospiraceae bacterium 2226]